MLVPGGRGAGPAGGKVCPSDTSTMTLEDAKCYRELLMQERKFLVDEHNEQLCE